MRRARDRSVSPLTPLSPFPARPSSRAKSLRARESTSVCGGSDEVPRVPLSDQESDDDRPTGHGLGSPVSAEFGRRRAPIGTRIGAAQETQRSRTRMRARCVQRPRAIRVRVLREEALEVDSARTPLTARRSPVSDGAYASPQHSPHPAPRSLTQKRAEKRKSMFLPRSTTLPTGLHEVAHEAAQATVVPAVAVLVHAQLCEAVLEREGGPASPEATQELIMAGGSRRVPKVEKIMRFLSRVQHGGAFADEYFLIALLYFLRFRAETGEVLAPGDWRGALLVCVMLAQKVYDDEPVVNSEFRKVYPELEVSDINELEAVLLLGMGWNVHCSYDAYSQYYVHLTTMTWEETTLAKAQAAVKKGRARLRATLLRRQRPWGSPQLAPPSPDSAHSSPRPGAA